MMVLVREVPQRRRKPLAPEITGGLAGFAISGGFWSLAYFVSQFI